MMGFHRLLLVPGGLSALHTDFPHLFDRIQRYGKDYEQELRQAFPHLSCLLSTT